MAIIVTVAGAGTTGLVVLTINDCSLWIYLSHSCRCLSQLRWRWLVESGLRRWWCLVDTSNRSCSIGFMLNLALNLITLMDFLRELLNFDLGLLHNCLPLIFLFLKPLEIFLRDLIQNSTLTHTLDTCMIIDIAKHVFLTYHLISLKFGQFQRLIEFLSVLLK